MTHGQLVTVLTATHAAVFLGALAAYYKFGDRTEVQARSLQGTEQAMRDLRRLIAAELAETLRRDLNPTNATVPTLLLEATTTSYVERPSNVFAGEEYRDSIRRFVEVNSLWLVDCRNIVMLRDAWSRRARRLSWIVLALAVYEGVVTAALAFLDRTEVVSFSDSLIKWAAAPTVVMAVGCLACIIGMQRAHDRISDIRVKYADLSA